jgi:hypothetical protein
VKTLLQGQTPYKFILGCRDVERAKADYDALGYNKQTHSISFLPLELAHLKGVKAFAQETIQELGDKQINYLFLNAALNKPANEPGINGSKWCEAYLVNHLCPSQCQSMLPILIMRSATLLNRAAALQAGTWLKSHRHCEFRSDPNAQRSR